MTMPRIMRSPAFTIPNCGDRSPDSLCYGRNPKKPPTSRSFRDTWAGHCSLATPHPSAVRSSPTGIARITFVAKYSFSALARGGLDVKFDHQTDAASWREEISGRHAGETRMCQLAVPLLHNVRRVGLIFMTGQYNQATASVVGSPRLSETDIAPNRSQVVTHRS